MIRDGCEFYAFVATQPAHHIGDGAPAEIGRKVDDPRSNPYFFFKYAGVSKE